MTIVALLAGVVALGLIVMITLSLTYPGQRLLGHLIGVSRRAWLLLGIVAVFDPAVWASRLSASGKLPRRRGDNHTPILRGYFYILRLTFCIFCDSIIVTCEVELAPRTHVSFLTNQMITVHTLCSPDGSQIGITID